MNASHADELHFGASPTGRGFRLTASQFHPLPREQVFEFFADAWKLEAITPPWLRFQVATPGPIAITAGTLIDYRLRIHGFPLRWQSRISEWAPPHRFVDEQTRGPYRRWRHEHVFESAAEGTLCRDVVDYDVLGGRVINQLLVQPDLRRIFRYRCERLTALLMAAADSDRQTAAATDSESS
jgi:ligand-binding SRPBCC domain-containing protein